MQIGVKVPHQMETGGKNLYFCEPLKISIIWIKTKVKANINKTSVKTSP